MSSLIQLKGAVLTCGDPDIGTVVALLSTPYRAILEYVSFANAAEFDFDEQFDFVVVSRLPCMVDLIKGYDAYELALPLFIHLVHPRLILEIDYPDLFPGVEIVPVPQASLDLMDITLKYDQFVNTIERLLSQKL